MALTVGDVFAGFVIEQVLGAGGMGVVYAARHPRLDRLVALKVLNDTLAADRRAHVAFEREAAVAARLDHPNIVTIHDRSAPDDPVLWLAMRHISGGDTASLLGRHPGGLPPELVVELLTDAASALDHAHAQGVLHRDVKPANLLIEPDPRHGQRAVLTDFGIARTLDSTVTLSGISASFAYAAPERFTGAPADHRTDIYSLGATLFHLLTGRHPFPREDQAAVIGAHLSAPPPEPSRLRADLPVALDAVIAIAMAKNPEDRYPTCAALAEATRTAWSTARTGSSLSSGASDRRDPGRSDTSFTASGTVTRPSAPAPPGPPPPSEVSAGSASPALPTPSTSSAFPAPRITVGGTHGPTPTNGPTGGRIGRRRMLIGAAFALPVTAATGFFLTTRRPPGGETATDTAATPTTAGRIPTAPRAAVIAGTPSPGAAVVDDILKGHTGDVQSVTFSPDGTVLATGSDDRMIRLWDPSTRLPIGQPLTGHTDNVRSVTFSPDGTILATGSDDTTVRLWDPRTGQQIGQPITGADSDVTSVSFSPDGTQLAAAYWDEHVSVWDIRTRQQIGEPINGHRGECAVAFSPDGTQFATSGWDNRVMLWDAQTHRAIGRPLTAHTGTVYAVAFSPDGTLLATAGGDKTVWLWDARTRELIGQPFTGHTDYVRSVAFNSDGTLLATASEDETVRLWDARTHQQIGDPLTGYEMYTLSVAFSPDGTLLASGGMDDTVRLWTLPQPG